MEFIQALLKNEGSFLFILVRVSAFLFALPFIGGRGTPMIVKLMLVLSMTLVLFPFLKLKVAPLNQFTLVVGLFNELLIGMVLGMGARFIFAAVEIGAELMGIQMGFGIANVFDPISSQQVSLAGQLMSLLALLIFFLTETHHVILQALVVSFEVIPPFGAHFAGSVIEQLIRMGSQMFSLGMKIAAPLTLLLLIVNVSMGVLSRVVPQINIMLFSFPITVGMGLFVFGATVSLMLGLIHDQMRGVERSIYQLLIGLRPP